MQHDSAHHLDDADKVCDLGKSDGDIGPSDSIRSAPLPGLPAWITPDLIHDTIRVWQPFYKVTLTWEDAVAMLKNVAALSRVAFVRGLGATIPPASPG
jgi:hypothetical protein